MAILNYFYRSSAKKTLPDIILLCETWLTENNSGKFSINGYSVVEKHRAKSKGGGVVLYLRKDFKYQLRDDLSVFEEGQFVSIFVEITSRKNDRRLIGEIYIPGETNANQFCETYDELIGKMSQENAKIIIGDDLKMDLLK